MKETTNTIILAVAILLAVVIYCFCTRYQIAGAGAGQANWGQAYQVDRITGETWFLNPTAKEKLQEKP
jgi:hypothetical protein